MHIFRGWFFTVLSVAVAGVVLGINQIGDFFLFAPPDQFYLDVMVSGLLVAAGVLLDQVLLRLARERKLRKELERTNAELRESLANIRVLHGLLPICANCKKIRDDKGYWEQIEDYLREHTNADFSHGFCPECVEKLYGKDLAAAERKIAARDREGSSKFQVPSSKLPE